MFRPYDGRMIFGLVSLIPALWVVFWLGGVWCPVPAKLTTSWWGFPWLMTLIAVFVGIVALGAFIGYKLERHDRY